MTTRVTTNELQVFKRTWLDLDPKVRNAGEVWVLTLLLCILGIATKAMNWLDAGYLVLPVTLAVFTAYVTTSKHKNLDLTGLIKDVGVVTDALSPVASRLAPVAAPAIAVADKVVRVVENAVQNPEATAEKADQSFTEVIGDMQRTQVLPPRSAAFLEALASKNGTGNVVDGGFPAPPVSTATAGISVVSADHH